MSCGNPNMNMGPSPSVPVRKVQENFDSSVCASQPVFQDALKKSIDGINKDNMKKIRPWLIVYVVIWTVFVVWGILLAMRIGSPVERTEHVLFATVFGPLYVLAYYISVLVQKSPGAVMGMCHMKY